MFKEPPSEERAQKLAIESIAYQGGRVVDIVYALSLGSGIGFVIGVLIAEFFL